MGKFHAILPNENCFKVVEILEIYHVYDKNDLYLIKYKNNIIASAKSFAT